MNINESLQRLPELRFDSAVPKEAAAATAGTRSADVAVHVQPATPPPPKVAEKAPVEQKAPSKEELDRIIKNIAAQVQSYQRSLQFSVDKDSGEVVVRIVDATTKEVIRQIPSQEILDLANRMRSMTGLLLKEQV
ncbi:MAG: flagellar protein FlaG [Gammaproteobacteria bacterium]|nr:flagellar protein FlaG [Gammaproteobacteria bacterium]MBI5615819.1 flagellar protein FlaG [Gammaproteobacteria bacterium]